MVCSDTPGRLVFEALGFRSICVGFDPDIEGLTSNDGR
ncbi:hypothetical protein Z946_857 [Sulfitobacter noctilucicola]|nr:hypothetical protein Z946_857 [Sulfitobacter noctilucicola]